MLYLARMDVTFPESMSPETKADFVAQEKEYSGNLQREGKMLDIWRVVGSTPTTPSMTWPTMTSCTPCSPASPCTPT